MWVMASTLLSIVAELILSPTIQHRATLPTVPQHVNLPSTLLKDNLLMDVEFRAIFSTEMLVCDPKDFQL